MIDARIIRDLLHIVPRPPEAAIPEGLSDYDLDAFVQRTGIDLPNELREWLKISNGPCVGPGGLLGIRPERKALDIELVLDILPSWRTKKWIPVAGDGCGNSYICPSTWGYGTCCPVMFIDTIEGVDSPSYVVASSVGHFLIAILEREVGARGWPFDRDTVIAADPEMLNVTGVPMPWKERL